MASSENKFRPRTHSDPDLPQLLPLPQRPHSSYEPKHKTKEKTQFSGDVISAVSNKLGIDLGQAPELRWAVRDCLLALKQLNWEAKVAKNAELVYENTMTEDQRTHHPTVELYQQLAARLLIRRQNAEAENRDRFHRVRQVVFNAIAGETDVRRVTTPAIVERVLQDMGVSVQDEVHLVRRIKVTMEDAYFRYLEKPSTTTIDSCIDTEQLTVQLELDRILLLLQISPSGLLYCVECETSLGDVACGACHDVFCNACMVSSHATGHRLDHPAVFVEQYVCSECEVRAAPIRCQDCVDLFCFDCFRRTHAKGKRQRHCVRLAQTTFCFECDTREAVYMCLECEDALCVPCSNRVHRRGGRRTHVLFGLRKAAYSKKLFADNVGRVEQLLTKNLQRQLSLCPWLLFYDEALAPFWYNFQTRERVRADVNDTKTPPQPEVDGEGGMSVDAQLRGALPGGTDLLESQAAKKASESAIFDVPPPLHVKFAAPSNTNDMDFGPADFKAELKADVRGGV